MNAADACLQKKTKKEAVADSPQETVRLRDAVQQMRMFVFVIQV